MLNLSFYHSITLSLLQGRIFKESGGWRSITSLELLSNGGPQYFYSYPSLVAIEDGDTVIDSRKATLSQTLLYGAMADLDVLMRLSGSHSEIQYTDHSGFQDRDEDAFESLWVGASYRFGTVAEEFKPSLTLQLPLSEQIRYQGDDSTNTFKAVSLKGSLRHFSDPLISTLYVTTTRQFKRRIGERDVKLPDTYGVGLDLSLILNAKVSLNFNFDQSWQTRLEENGDETGASVSVPTLGFGATYSLNTNNSLTLSASTGASSDAPDSLFGLSWWHRFD